MSFNGAGVFNINSAGNPVVTNTVISSTWLNALTADLGVGLSTAICKDGQTTITANIPMSGFKLTGIGAPTTAGDALRFGTLVTVPNGGTGVGTLTGLAKGNGTSAFSAATAGTDYGAPGTPATWTMTQTFIGATNQIALVLANAAEVETITAAPATGTINFYLHDQSILWYTTNATGNWTINLTFSNVPTTIDSVLSTSQSTTCVFKAKQGGTAFYNNVVQVDGTTTGVTTVWQGGAPTQGNINGYDVYTYEIVKTGSATFTVWASVSPYR